MAKYMQVVWLYLIGLAVILVGVYTLITSPGPMTFIMMLVGLAVAAIGAAHGRKIRMQGQFDMDQTMRDDDLEPEGAEKPEQGEAEEKEEAPPAEEPEEPEKAPSGGFRGLIGSFMRRPNEPLSDEEIVQLEIEDIKEGKIVPTEADVIEFVCPVCSAENEERNYYCFTCGNKLRRKTPEEDDAGKTHLKVEPGSIEIVDEQRVAKVVMCPECNIPNKVRNKFCWSCGKKIKSETLEDKKIQSEKAIEPPEKKAKSKKKVNQFKK